MSKLILLFIAVALMLNAATVSATTSMASGLNSWQVSAPLLTVGETVNGYTPPGIVDGLGAIKWNADTVRVYANHELKHNKGYAYRVKDGNQGFFSMTGARISYFDIDRKTKEIIDAGLAYESIHDANGNAVKNTDFLVKGYKGFSRFCSSSLVEANTFSYLSDNQKAAMHRGLQDNIYFAGEESGGEDAPVGGAEWALDIKNRVLWQVSAMGRGAWENVSIVDTGNQHEVAFILADDTAPFDVDGDGSKEAAPLYLYIGEKQQQGNFLQRNGLAEGKLYVWVSRSGERSPSDFNGAGSLQGDWLEIDNSQNTALAMDDGSKGYDEYGYPTQRTLWSRAEKLGAFGFSRPEDVAYNPAKPNQVVMASTGRQKDFDGADAFGTVYTLTTDFRDRSSLLTIVYDGDADPRRQIRSPDNLDWADNGRILIQEDKAINETLDGEVLFGNGAANPNEAGIVELDPQSGAIRRVANINREVVLDPTTQEEAFDQRPEAGSWESSGIVDVSTLFSEQAGSLFLFTVQAHGIHEQADLNIDSRIKDDDLVEGGQLLFLQAPGK